MDDDYSQYAVAIANGIDSLNNQISADRNREFQAEEAEKAREWSSTEAGMNRAWEELMYNKYNSPSAMMRQYKDAGLNPYLLGGGTGLIGQGMSLSAPMAPSSPLPSGAQAAPSVMAGNYAQMVGINAQAANQHAQAIQQKWETYQYIREHVGKDAAQKYLDNNPDMLQSSDPDNDPWMKAYKRQETKENIENDMRSWEFSLKQLYGVKQAEKEIYHLQALCDDLYSQINLRSASEKEIDATIKKILEQIKTEKSLQSRNYAEAGLSSAKAKTENKSRMYVVKMLMSKSHIFDRLDQTDLAHFESEDALRAWLRSIDGRVRIRDAARNAGIVNSDMVVKALWMLLGNVNIGFTSGVHSSPGFEEISN